MHAAAGKLFGYIWHLEVATSRTKKRSRTGYARHGTAAREAPSTPMH